MALIILTTESYFSVRYKALDWDRVKFLKLIQSNFDHVNYSHGDTSINYTYGKFQSPILLDLNTIFYTASPLWNKKKQHFQSILTDIFVIKATLIVWIADYII